MLGFWHVCVPSILDDNVLEINVKFFTIVILTMKFFKWHMICEYTCCLFSHIFGEFWWIGSSSPLILLQGTQEGDSRGFPILMFSLVFFAPAVHSQTSFYTLPGLLTVVAFFMIDQKTKYAYVILVMSNILLIYWLPLINMFVLMEWVNVMKVTLFI